LREFHCNKVIDDTKPVHVGVVTVYKENKKRGKWKMAEVESCIKGQDEVVTTGANTQIIAKGKPTWISRPVQRLYPIEVQRDAVGKCTREPICTEAQT